MPPNNQAMKRQVLFGTVFQTAVLLCFMNPETSSRVTLASLGTVFQTEVTNRQPITNNLFLSIDISPYQCSIAYGLFRPRSKSITDNTDATDFIFSRILYCLLDLNMIFLRLSARDSSS